MKRPGLLALLLNVCFSPCLAQSGDAAFAKKKYVTSPLSGSIKFDGIPDEEAWNAVQWGGDFIQQQPNEGQAPSQPTNFKILYDEKFLYIAYRAHDSAPDSIVKRMGRRDE